MDISVGSPRVTPLQAVPSDLNTSRSVLPGSFVAALPSRPMPVAGYIASAAPGPGQTLQWTRLDAALARAGHDYGSRLSFLPQPGVSRVGWVDYTFGRARIRARLVDGPAGPQAIIEHAGQVYVVQHFLRVYEAVEVHQLEGRTGPPGANGAAQGAPASQAKASATRKLEASRLDETQSPVRKLGCLP